MARDFYAFGEILWDCLPSAGTPRRPFNVTAHLAQFGVSVYLFQRLAATR